MIGDSYFVTAVVYFCATMPIWTPAYIYYRGQWNSGHTKIHIVSYTIIIERLLYFNIPSYYDYLNSEVQWLALLLLAIMTLGGVFYANYMRTILWNL